ncbi:unnamed protein product [Phytophthora fragariaefolia]|uniref:Unnamed protein product n=1 Tax=Phytophthora fragariaefolia TaxID=1490495 RepID=A0A9W6YGT6_9STRA|nr:unnamed protein product [Phytophthora fragariaefolia]
MSKKKKVVVPKNFGTVPFTLDASDLALAKSFGLLREDTPMNILSPQDDNFGVAQDDKCNIGDDFYQTQKAIQQRCIQFAPRAGFQLIVQCSSS